jgi:hypothetical protein
VPWFISLEGCAGLPVPPRPVSLYVLELRNYRRERTFSAGSIVAVGNCFEIRAPLSLPLYFLCIPIFGCAVLFCGAHEPHSLSLLSHASLWHHSSLSLAFPSARVPPPSPIGFRRRRLCSAAALPNSGI